MAETPQPQVDVPTKEEQKAAHNFFNQELQQQFQTIDTDRHLKPEQKNKKKAAILMDAFEHAQNASYESMRDFAKKIAKYRQFVSPNTDGDGLLDDPQEHKMMELFNQDWKNLNQTLALYQKFRIAEIKDHSVQRFAITLLENIIPANSNITKLEQIFTVSDSEIRKINLSGLKIEGKLPNALPQSLKHLNLSNSDITTIPYYNGEEIDLQNTPITELPDHILYNPNIKRIDISNTKVDFEKIRQIDGTGQILNNTDGNTRIFFTKKNEE